MPVRSGNSALRVLFLNSRSELGGADICLLEIVKHLDKNKVAPYIVLPQPGPLVDEFRQAGAAEIIYANLNPLERPDKPLDALSFLLGVFPSSFELVSIIKRCGIDVVYTNSSAIQTGAIAAFLSRKPHVWHIREIWSSPAIVGRALYWFAYHFAHHIIAISNAVRVSNFPTRTTKITTVYDGIDLRRFQGQGSDERLGIEFGIPAGAVVIGVIARLIPWKGHRVVLEAARQLILEQRNVHIAIVGDIPRPTYQSYKDELLRYAREEHIAENIHFVGWSQDVPSWLRVFTALVLPSVLPEPMGVVIPEAWAAAVPVIASRHGGPQEIIQSGVNGILFEPGDAGELYEALKLVLNDNELRGGLIEAGHKSVQALFDAAQNTQLIERILFSAADARPA